MKYVTVAIACLVLCGFRNSDQKNVVHPDNSQNQQQGPKSGLPAKPTVAPQFADKNAGDSGGQNKQTQNQKVSLVSIPEVRTEQRKDVLDWLMLFFTAVLAITGIVGTCYALQTLRSIQTEVRVRSSRCTTAANSPMPPNPAPKPRNTKRML